MARGNLNPSPATRFKPGVSGNPAGRAKATCVVENVLNELGIDPVRKLLELEPDLKPFERLKLWTTLLEYVAVKAQVMQTPSIPLTDLLQVLTRKSIDAAEKLAEIDA